MSCGCCCAYSFDGSGAVGDRRVLLRFRVWVCFVPVEAGYLAARFLGKVILVVRLVINSDATQWRGSGVTLVLWPSRSSECKSLPKS